MKWTEIDILGVYVAPISVMMIIAWVVTIALRRAAIELGILQRVWHPALFGFGVYVIVLSSIVLVVGR